MEYVVTGGATSESWSIEGRGEGRVVKLAMSACAVGGRPV
jgi:hypothetical protein